MECFVCCESLPSENFFKCKNCDFEACIDCNKKVLLESTNDPHCMNCKAIIPYDDFLGKFNNKKNWVLSTYKKHKEKILFNREKSLFPVAIEHIAKEKKILEIETTKTKFCDGYLHNIKPYNDQITELRKKILEIEIIKKKIHEEYLVEVKPYNDQIRELRNVKDKKNKKYNYNYACPDPQCHGFLNEDFKCDLCDSEICKKCYTKINFVDGKSDHECDEENVESFKQIKKEAKPCPKCGEFISKIDGCDQMFCIAAGCGTSFSWKTGIIEQGVIHNPHAHQWFNQNPEARDMYVNNINRRNANNGCRNFVPHQHELVSNNDDVNFRNSLTNIHRTVMEFRNYTRQRYINYIQHTNNNENEDLRLRFLQKTIQEKHYKSQIHKRDKERQFKTNIFQILLIMFETAELYLWEITNEENIENKRNIFQNMLELKTSTNNKIQELIPLFGYSRSLQINDSFRGYPYI